MESYSWLDEAYGFAEGVLRTSYPAKRGLHLFHLYMSQGLANISYGDFQNQVLLKTFFRHGFVVVLLFSVLWMIMLLIMGIALAFYTFDVKRVTARVKQEIKREPQEKKEDKQTLQKSLVITTLYLLGCVTAFILTVLAMVALNDLNMSISEPWPHKDSDDTKLPHAFLPKARHGLHKLADYFNHACQHKKAHATKLFAQEAARKMGEELLRDNAEIEQHGTSIRRFLKHYDVIGDYAFAVQIGMNYLAKIVKADHTKVVSELQKNLKVWATTVGELLNLKTLPDVQALQPEFQPSQVEMNTANPYDRISLTATQYILANDADISSQEMKTIVANYKLYIDDINATGKSILTKDEAVEASKAIFEKQLSPAAEYLNVNAWLPFCSSVKAMLKDLHKGYKSTSVWLERYVAPVTIALFSFCICVSLICQVLLMVTYGAQLWHTHKMLQALEVDDPEQVEPPHIKDIVLYRVIFHTCVFLLIVPVLVLLVAYLYSGLFEAQACRYTRMYGSPAKPEPSYDAIVMDTEIMKYQSRDWSAAQALPAIDHTIEGIITGCSKKGSPLLESLYYNVSGLKWKQLITEELVQLVRAAYAYTVEKTFKNLGTRAGQVFVQKDMLQNVGKLSSVVIPEEDIKAVERIQMFKGKYEKADEQLILKYLHILRTYEVRTDSRLSDEQRKFLSTAIFNTAIIERDLLQMRILQQQALLYVNKLRAYSPASLKAMDDARSSAANLATMRENFEKRLTHDIVRAFLADTIPDIVFSFFDDCNDVYQGYSQLVGGLCSTLVGPMAGYWFFLGIAILHASVGLVMIFFSIVRG